jgi:O-antigen ligase
VSLTAGLVLTLAWGAFAFGAVYPWAYVPLGIACAVVGGYGLLRGRLQSWASDVRSPEPGVRGCFGAINPPLAVGLALVALAILIQLVPLPHDTLVRLNPATDAFLRRYDLQYAATAELEAAVRQTEAVRHGEVTAAEKEAGQANPAKAGSQSPEGGAGSHEQDRGGSHPMSIDPGQTLLGLGLLAVFGVFLLGLARGLTARDARRIAPWVLGLGVVLALVGIIQAAGFNGKIYGFWVPQAGIRGFTPTGGTYGPFVNRNHFAGWMLMGLSVGLGYFCALVARAMRDVKPTFHDRVVWASSPEASRVVLVAAGLIVMAIALVMSLSRSGISCLVVLLGLLGFVVVRRQEKTSRRLVVFAYVLLLGALAIGWVGLDVVAGRFVQAEADVSLRTAIWNDALHVYRDFPVFGSGINTFGTAMMVYQTADPSVHFAEAHNDYVQFLSEGGLLVTIPALVLLVLFVREVRRRFRDDTDDRMTYWIRIGAVTGVVAIGLQEIVEFSLQMPGNAAMFCALMAVAAGKLPHRRRGGRDGKSDVRIQNWEFKRDLPEVRRENCEARRGSRARRG